MAASTVKSRPAGRHRGGTSSQPTARVITFDRYCGVNAVCTFWRPDRVHVMLHVHCSHCGLVWPADLPWPRVCAGCGETTWSNPLPVAVVLLPVKSGDGQTGLVVVRRDIEPFRGELALP